MTEVPHCPDCNRADVVTVRTGPGYEYYCRGCNSVFDPDDVTDAAWIDMVSNTMFSDPQQAQNRSKNDYSDDCECDWCERGRPGIEEMT